MAIPSLNTVPNDADLQRTIIALNQNMEELDWLFGGKVDFKNIRAEGIETKNLKAGSVTADKITVKELSAISANLGHITAGLVEAITMIGSEIKTSETQYPRAEMSSTSQLFAAYRIASDFIKIYADLTGSPTIEFNNGTTRALMSAVVGTMIINTMLGNLQLFAQSGDLLLKAGPAKKVKVDSWDSFYSTGDGNGSGITLKQELNGKASAFTGVNGTVYVSSTPGGPANVPINFTNGVRTS